MGKAVDPVCGMEVEVGPNSLFLVDGDERLYFCSMRCLERYAKEHGLEPKCMSCAPSGLPWYKERLFLVSLVFAGVFAASYLMPLFFPGTDALTSLRENLVSYTLLIWWAVLLGLLIGGVIDFFVPREYISKTLAGKGRKSIFYAVLLGFLMSACSHGILALSMQLYKKGASIPSVIAFLLASPWANLTYTLLLFSLFGWEAFIIIFSAVVIAIISGFIFQFLDSSGRLETSPYSVSVAGDFSIRSDIKNRIEAYSFKASDIPAAASGVLSGSWSLARMVLWWIMIGVLFASIIGAFLPAHLFMAYLGPTLMGLFITLLFATIVEVCSEGSSPIAFEIYAQTGAFGNSFVYLLAGVATDYTEIGLIWSNIGKKTALYLPLVAAPQILVLGFLFNLFL